MFYLGAKYYIQEVYTVHIIYLYNVYVPGVGEAVSSFVGSGNTAMSAI